MTRHTLARSFARSNALLASVVLTAAMAVPAVLAVLSQQAGAAQLGARFIDMSATQTSEGSGRDGGDAFGQDVTYSVSFTLTSAHANLEGIVIDFCSNSPIIGDACTAPTGFNTNFATLGSTLATDDDLNSNWQVDTTNSDANTVILVDSTTTGDNLGASTVVEFDLGTTAVTDGFTNPTTPGSFYARIVTFTDDTVAAAYTSGTPGAYTDEGGIALAVANQLDITARVQEILEFCVGTADANVNSNCTDISGTDVDLGVVDSSAVNDTTASPSYALIRTNAFNGASIYYKAEQESGSGQLKINGATCGVPSVALDRCFNSAVGSGTGSAPVGSTIDGGTEEFGMTLTSVDTSNGGATTNLSRDAAYDGDGSTGGACTAADAGTDEACWAWADAGNFDRIAVSSSVADYEMVTLAFAATASPTTPTGLYTVTANFVATATF